MATNPEVSVTDLEPLLVKIAGGDKDVAADWGSWQSFPIGPGIPPQQILAQNNKRKEAEIVVQAAIAALVNIQNSGTANLVVVAGQLITSVTLQPGTYVVNWSVQISGTSSAADASNFQVMLNGSNIATSINSSTTGNVYTQTQFTVTVTTPNSVLSVNALATPTATANYRAAISAAQQAAASGFVRIGTRAQIMNNQGGQLQVGRYPYEAKQEIWCGTDGVTNMVVVVLDERYE